MQYWTQCIFRIDTHVSVLRETNDVHVKKRGKQGEIEFKRERMRVREKGRKTKIEGNGI